MRKFKVGDKVTWFDRTGEVIDTSYEEDRAVVVYFGPNHGIKYFTEEGKSKHYYKIASLKLQEEK